MTCLNSFPCLHPSATKGFLAANAPEIAAVSTANVEASPGAAAAADAESVPRELKDLRRHLNYLKNIYEIKDSVSDASQRRQLRDYCIALTTRYENQWKTDVLFTLN